MSLPQFLRILWVWHRVILTCTALCFAAGVVVSLVRHRTYTAEARVMLDVLKPDPVSGDSISSSFARAYVPTQTELIRDYRVSGRVVDQTGMLQSPAAQAHFNANAGHGGDLRRSLADQISDATDASNVQGSNIIDISYRGSTPAEAAKMANLVRDAYVSETIASKQNDAARTAGFFERQLGDIRNQLSAAEERKVAFERANNVVLLGDDSDADTAHLQAVAGAPPPLPSVVAAGGGGASTASAQLADIDAKISAAEKTLGPNNPVLQDLRSQRAAAVASARASSGSGGIKIVGGGGGDIAGARAHVLAQRDKVEEARRYDSDVKVLRDQYAKMAARAADLRQQAASNESGITLLDSAVEPRRPDSPATAMIIFGALAAGLALGLFSAIALELLRRRVRSVEDLQGLNVPVLGVISRGTLAA